jgi:hypothetical protein
MALTTSIFRVELPLKWSQQTHHHKVFTDNSLHGIHILEAWLLHLSCLCRKCVVTDFVFVGHLWRIRWMPVGALSEVYAMCLQPFYGKGSHPLLWAGLWAPRGKINISGTSNCLNYCEFL